MSVTGFRGNLLFIVKGKLEAPVEESFKNIIYKVVRKLENSGNAIHFFEIKI